ncbi:putative quinol monooxygenase [Ottowia thiooxydans]|uniref:putative quinol monooxygenase n=1 Tax=Ottowia thiooxydans TaxID=219182 RepID=UPI0004182399|nr:putative quinol monooxygenase [Ottowia thiooxydans]
MIDQIVEMQALPGQDASLEMALMELARASLQLKGVERFEVYRSENGVGSFVLIERFASEAVIAQQRQSAHVRDFQAAVAGLRDGPARVNSLRLAME